MEADLYSTVVQICKLATTDNEKEGVLEYTMYRMEVLSVEMSHFELWVCTMIMITLLQTFQELIGLLLGLIY